MSALTITAGYPVHAIIRYHVLPNGVRHYRTACDRVDYTTAAFGRAGSARRLELCPTCFPGRTRNGYQGPDHPVQVQSREDV